MKKLILASLVTLTFAACNNPETSKTPEIKPIDMSQKLPIAVVNFDLLLTEYTFAIESNETLLKKQEDARANLNSKARQFQDEAAEFQRKLENNAFLSRERAEAEQRRLAKKEQDLQQLQEKLSNDLMVNQQNISKQMQDSIDSAISFINKDGQYHLILSNSAMANNVIFNAPEYDITSEVVKVLNDRYNKK